MTLALIAGTGGLPPYLAKSLAAQGRAPIICEMRGFASDVLGEFDRVAFRIETLGTFLTELKAKGVTQICMAGAVSRPAVDPAAIDAATAPLVQRLQAAMAKGDDGTLREIIAIFEETGFEVVGAHELAPELLANAGTHTKTAPPDLADTLLAAKDELDQMGRADQGQAMVLQSATVIAREGAGGTAKMLNELSDAAGAILFKGPKPNQNLLADMPLIGPETAMQASQAGLSGIVVQAGGVMVLDLPQVVAILDAHDMFLQVTQ